MPENNFDLTVIRNLRIKRGLTAEEMAGQANLTRSTVAKIESGRANPTLGTIGSIADVLGMSTTALLAMAETSRATLYQAEPFEMKGISGSRMVTPGTEIFHLKVESKAEAFFDPLLHENTQETMMVLTGSLEVTVDGRSHSLNQGQALSFKALQEHSIWSADGCSLIIVHYNSL
ncbi:helix-turn-helix domain-containing protein [Dethiosulfatarculus sandiegensis]|uniref:DNA-binding protein n=1 Tax=Dethiosulfatarculus sandiegensis TaxID=1429043 RepID=A0A0D2JXG9_9BACT|nr:XRE family transcriptional regulator [Dethiosulfatarculus sandiegensis]KIX14285.1 DNA-binding protein [Dethiosulfatarculus sandiegensis]